MLVGHPGVAPGPVPQGPQVLVILVLLHPGCHPHDTVHLHPGYPQLGQQYVKQFLICWLKIFHEFRLLLTLLEKNVIIMQTLCTQ